MIHINKDTSYCVKCLDCEGFTMGKRNKSKRFFQQSKDTVSKHAEKFPYRMTLADAEAQNGPMGYFHG